MGNCKHILVMAPVKLNREIVVDGEAEYLNISDHGDLQLEQAALPPLTGCQSKICISIRSHSLHSPELKETNKSKIHILHFRYQTLKDSD